jgi:deoxyribodipyrimidine photo-lyase
MNSKRVRLLREGPRTKGAVVYWMSRDQRADDNWALLFAQELAVESKSPLLVVFCLVPEFLGACMRQYAFMVRGLAEADGELDRKGIPLFLVKGQLESKLPGLLKKYRASALVTDFDPLRIKRRWKQQVAERINVPFYEVDTHNIVPCTAASEKCEYGAYTIRPKIQRLLGEFLVDIPKLKKHPFALGEKMPPVDWDKVLRNLRVNRSVAEVDWLGGGSRAGGKMLKDFLRNKLANYDRDRNDPNIDGQSNLSAYLHFGQISAQRVALEVQKADAPRKSKEAFLEELIVRKELSDNFCFYNGKYDTCDCFPEWAKKTLREHAKDKREYTYTLEEFERAGTHDPLWNAAQIEMVRRGKMHGYMRMYWGKKILEWTKTAEEAMEIAIYLNDKYELDGRDPNGYAGIAWSVGGVHDRAWPQHPVFGKIRYMSYSGCKSKFDVRQYIEKFQPRRGIGGRG